MLSKVLRLTKSRQFAVDREVPFHTGSVDTESSDLFSSSKPTKLNFYACNRLVVSWLVINRQAGLSPCGFIANLSPINLLLRFKLVNQVLERWHGASRVVLLSFCSQNKGSFTPDQVRRGAPVQCNAYGNASGVKAATRGAVPCRAVTHRNALDSVWKNLKSPPSWACVRWHVSVVRVCDGFDGFWTVLPVQKLSNLATVIVSAMRVCPISGLSLESAAFCMSTSATVAASFQHITLL